MRIRSMLMGIDDGAGAAGGATGPTAAHPYLFTEAQTPLGSTPGSSAGHRPADGAFDSEDSRIMTQLGVAGRKVRETAEYKRYGWLSDKNWKPQPRGHARQKSSPSRTRTTHGCARRASIRPCSSGRPRPSRV